MFVLFLLEDEPFWIRSKSLLSCFNGGFDKLTNITVFFYQCDQQKGCEGIIIARKKIGWKSSQMVSTT